MNMKSLLVVLMIAIGITAISSCSGAKLCWYTSNGIVTYNRHTGQFEMLWENAGQSQGKACSDTCNCPYMSDSVKRGR